MCVGVCVLEREGGKEGERERERKREKESERCSERSAGYFLSDDPDW